MGIWNLRSVNCFNPFGYPLSYWTDEILDSYLSLSRFTSLVQWKYVSDPQTNPQARAYRPMRETKAGGGPGVTLRYAQYGQEISENGYLWTGASDGTITVGWIVRNYPQNYNVPEYQDVLTPDTAPWVEISGLTPGIPLELAWFDDQKGQLLPSRTISPTGGGFGLQAPNTEAGGFGKSIAFLIQPVGFTPNKSWEALPSFPNHVIGQIEVSPRGIRWLEEGLEVPNHSLLTFSVTTKPQITNHAAYRYDWYFYYCNSQDPIRTIVDGGPQVTLNYSTLIEQQPDCFENNWHMVKVDITERQSGRRISGDIIHVRPWP